MPNQAQIEADLCVSNMGGLFFGFDYRVAQKRRGRGLYYYILTNSQVSIIPKKTALVMSSVSSSLGTRQTGTAS